MATNDKQGLATATFGAGCFWGVEDLLGKVNGVKETEVGYEGGALEHPTYEDVCTNTTGHAEVVQLRYDPSIVSYEELLAEFWRIHDPTTMNQQGPDIGTQYRSVIFYHTPEQQQAAEASKAALEKSSKYGNKEIVTEIVPATTFWRAEEYHQKYAQKHPGAVVCHT